MAIIGMRREDKSVWERRAPLVPQDVRRLVATERVRLTVQPSERRIFADDEYREAGAIVDEDLTACDLILGIKEVPTRLIFPEKTYMFFSHTIKGQPHNMPMLHDMLEKRCTLFDHELVTNEEGKRLIAFGRYAGLAGAIDSLWILGKRLDHEGIPNPFNTMRQSLDYNDLDSAREAVRLVADEIRTHGLGEELRPFVIGLTGHGNVGSGAREILTLLPHVEARPSDLAHVHDLLSPAGKNVLLIHWETPELVEPISPDALFSREDYRRHPERYRSKFSSALSDISLLVHGIQWSVGSPRFVTREDLRHLMAGERPKLKVIGDISCDVNGSLECTVRTTDPGNPSYVYDPESHSTNVGVIGRGVVVVPVEIFPAEFPRDASRHFSKALSPMVVPLARMSPALGPSDPALPLPLRRSAIAVGGRLLPEWEEKLRGPLQRFGTHGTNGGPE